MTLKRRHCLGTPLAALPLLAGAAGTTTAPAQPGERVNWPAVTLLDGRRLAPAHWQGRAAVVVFWTTTCPFCRRHNVHVDKLHRAALAQGLPLQVLGVSRDRDPAAVRRYMAQYGYSFEVTLDAEPLRTALASRNMIPLTAVVQRDGRLQQVLPGEMFEEDVMELQQLARNGPPGDERRT